MNNPPRTSHSRPCAMLAALTLCLGSVCLALPEDAGKPTVFDGSDSEYLQKGDLSILVLTGTNDAPASITQGTLKISGLKIELESRNEAILKITATGQPASFQQQLAANEAAVLASGQQVTLDNTAKVLSVHKNAELIQEGRTITAHHFEYDLQTRNYKANMSPDGERVRIVIPPAAPQL